MALISEWEIAAENALSATISLSLVKTIIFDLVSRKISFFFSLESSIIQLNEAPKNSCQPHFLVSNKVQNIRQHHF